MPSATLTNRATGLPLKNSNIIRRDSLRLDLQIVDYELTGATIAFSMKRDPLSITDLLAEAKVSTADGGIVITNNTGNQLHAVIALDNLAANLVPDPGEYLNNTIPLHFDLQIERPSPVSAPPRQTYFRSDRDRCYLIPDVTHEANP